MNEFLETLKSRMVEAQRRLQETTLKLQTAQAEHSAANAEALSWQKAVEVETKRTIAFDGAGRELLPLRPIQQVATEAEPTSNNQTAMIRQMLQQHATGMTPTEIWNAAKGQMKRRSYLYAVLQRLKDREQVTVRRGKYYFRPEEAKTPATIIQ